MTTKHLLLFAFLLIFGRLSAQNSDFFGKTVSPDVCPVQAEGVDTKDATDALNKICAAADLPNNFTLVPCMNVGNCFALYKDGVSYVVYDKQFLKRVQTFGFTEKKLPGSVDWVALTILSHELGHHLCQHTTNPSLLSKFTPAQLELQADEFAGAIMFKLGATLAQAQKAMDSQGVTEAASATHPAKKDRLEAIAKGYNKNAGKSTNTPVNDEPPSDGRITFVIPQFQVIASNVRPNLAEQMKQLLVTNMESNGTYNIVASSFDVNSFRHDPAVAYGGEQAIKRANYVLLGKIMSYNEKKNEFGIGGYSANLGTTISYTFSFEVINAKTNQLVLTKNWDFKVKAGNFGVTTAGSNGLRGNMNLDPDVAGAYEKKLKDVVKKITEEKSKIVLN